MKTWKTYAAGIGYASIFGFSFLITKDALSTLDPFELLFLRFLLAALAMSALVAVRAVKVDFRGKPWKNLMLACVFQPILYFACETLGVRESATSTAGIVLGAMPAAVAILGVFMLKEKMTKLQTLFLALSVAGVASIVLSGSGRGASLGTPRGIAFLFGALVSASFYNVFSRKASKSFTPIETTFAMMWTGALFFGAIAVLKGLAAGTLLGSTGLLARSLPLWTGILYLGLLSSVLAFFFINYTLSRVKASQSVVFANLTTVVAVVAGVLFRGEPFGLLQMLGAFMIIAGVWGTNAAGQASTTVQA